MQDQIAAFLESGNLTDTNSESGWRQFDEVAPAAHEHQRRGHHHRRQPQLVGDGSPIQRHMYTQLSYQTPCDHCHILSAKTTADAWGLTDDHPEWTSGGFEVERHFNRKERHGYCEGDASGGKYCMWWDIAFTEYTVQGPDGGKSYKIRSPNVGNAGGHGPFCMPAAQGWCPGAGTYFWNSAAYANRPGAPAK